MKEIGGRVIGKTEWYLVCQTFCKNIVIQRPRTDLCSTCQGNILSLSKMHALTEEEKKMRLERTLFVHADNCVAQNKNNALMRYLLWRTMNKSRNEITISFLPVGHTKFAPNVYFGLFKQRFRYSDVSSLK